MLVAMNLSGVLDSRMHPPNRGLAIVVITETSDKTRHDMRYTLSLSIICLSFIFHIASVITRPILPTPTPLEPSLRVSCQYIYLLLELY